MAGTRSKQGKRWEILPQASDDIVEQLLKNRGIKKNDREKFLNPKYEDLYDPFLMMGMEKAVDRLIKAVKNKETVGIFGDYDADGIPAAALLWEVLTKHDLKVEVYIPMRNEGYGLNEKGINYFKDKQVTLIITVDTGVTGDKEISLAKSLGIETIVTDHHEVQIDKLPKDAVAVIDTKQAECQYPFKELCATAVAFKLATALVSKTKKIENNQLKWLLDLVAISTICDMVPLVSENRILAKYGLMVLKKTRRAGLQQIYKAAGIEADKITPYVVGFLIGPRINAPGRMGDINTPFNLLIENDEEKAELLAGELEGVNRDRQELLRSVLAEAEKKVEKDNLAKNKVIMVDGKGWPEGIIGLVAGKLTEKYGRPAIVIGRGDEESRGSARSIEGFHLVEVLSECEEYLIKHGGHAKAAGLTVATEHLETLYDRILEIAEEKLTEQDLIPKLTAEAKIKLPEIDWQLFESLKQFEPFGLGNPRPIFMSEGAKVQNVSVVGNGGKHLKCELTDGDNRIKLAAIGFDLGDSKPEYPAGTMIDLVYTIDEDAWRGGKNLQLKLIDIKLSGS